MGTLQQRHSQTVLQNINLEQGAKKVRLRQNKGRWLICVGSDVDVDVAGK